MSAATGLLADLVVNDAEPDLASAHRALRAEARASLSGHARERFDAALRNAELVYAVARITCC